MATARKRKVADQANDAGFQHDAAATMAPSRVQLGGVTTWRLCQCCFVVLVVSITGVFLTVAFSNVIPSKLVHHGANILDRVSLALGVQEMVYAVVIDAGSTGSRVLAFSFHKSFTDGSLKLVDELFFEVKPGLSFFADEPQKGAETIEELLAKAKEVIPQSAWGSTPLVLKATAGLRLLPNGKANKLLNEVKDVFDKSQFWVSKNSVNILDGIDEGLFAWFTVNFLLDRLGGEIGHTIAALDLGGGSTQITFAPTEDATLLDSPPEYIHQVSAFHKSFSVYTHSYLGLGLMAVRKDVLTHDLPEGSTEVRSPCINPVVESEWEYAGVKYTIRGSKTPSYEHIKGKAGRISEERPIVNYDSCLKIVQSVVNRKVHRPAELNNREISAFSYYFDRAAERGLIDPFKGGKLIVQKFFKSAKEACSVPNTEQPFACLDLLYIAVLLRDGFGLKVTKELQLHKKIDGHEISWALGCAYHILQNGM